MTQANAETIITIIKDHVDVIRKLITGKGAPPPALMKRLNLPENITDLITTAYKYGKFQMINRRFSETLSDYELNRLVQNVKLTANQVKALEYVEMHTGENITALGAKITSDIVPALVNADLSQLQGIRMVVSAGILETESRGKVAQGLRDLSGDWDRDWDRVAQTEMWNAKLYSEAQTILDGTSAFSDKGGDTLVFKRPASYACNQCKRLYLEADGKTPRLFRLTDMMAYGTNAGLKTADWNPVFGTMHPNCGCPFAVMPDGAAFDENGRII